MSVTIDPKPFGASQPSSSLTRIVNVSQPSVCTKTLVSTPPGSEAHELTDSTPSSAGV